MFPGVMPGAFIIASMALVAFRLIHMRWGMENYDSVRYYRITMSRKQKIILAIVLVTLIGGLFGLSYWIKYNRNIKNTRDQSQIVSDAAKFKSEYMHIKKAFMKPFGQRKTFQVRKSWMLPLLSLLTSLASNRNRGVRWQFH